MAGTNSLLPLPVLHSPLRKSLKTIITSSWLNCLLIFIPFGYMAHGLNWGDTWIFVLNFFAIIPLAKLLQFVTEDIGLRFGQTIGGLLNAIFGNAVELIVFIVALMKREILLVQASMLGSIISNLLVVLGMCFVTGGVSYEEKNFNEIAVPSLMALAYVGLVVPAAFNFSVGSDNINKEFLSLSHGTAIVLLIIYILFLYFRFKARSDPYDEEGEEQLPFGVSLFLLAAVTVIVAFSVKSLIGSIEGIVNSSGLSKTFIGLIILPIVSNAADLSATVTFATKNETNLAINVAAGRSVQIVLFVASFLVLLGWIIGHETTLNFQSLEAVVLFISLLMANYIIQRYNLQKSKKRFWKIFIKYNNYLN